MSVNRNQLVHSRLDCSNSIFVGLPVYLQRRLQAVLNTATRLVFRLRRYDHVTDAVAILHWLRLPERVNFKLALMAYRVLHGMAPVYLNQLVPVSDLPSRRRLRSSSTLQLLVPPYRLTTVGRRSFRLQPPSSGTLHLSMSSHLHLPSPSVCG